MKLLFLSPWFPYPPDNGSKIHVYNLVRYLATKNDVTLVAFSDDGADTSGLNFCPKVMTINHNPFKKSRLLTLFRFFFVKPIVGYPVNEMSELVKTVIQENDFSAAIAFTTVMALYLLDFEKPKIFDIDTSLTGFAQERLRLEDSFAGKLQAWLSLQKTIIFERKLVSQFDATVIPSQDSYRSLTPILAKAKMLTIIGNAVNLSRYPFNNHIPESDSLIYNGSLTFSANYDAMGWFLNEIYPLIQQKTPNITIKITGKYDGVNLNSLPLSKGIELTGYVEDIRPLVAKSCICVIPIRIGGGQRLKILEAMALGTPVVSTTKGAEGLELRDGVHLRIADEPVEFAEAVTDLLRNETMRRMLSQNARQLMEEKYNLETILNSFQSLVENIVNVNVHP